MSGGYYNQPGQEAPQYLQQNFGYQPSPAYGQRAFAPASEEYLRQPPSAPYPTAPVHLHMPEPQPPMPVRMTEPHQESYSQEPRVIIVQQPAPRRREDDCCALASCVCRCVDWLLTRLCYVLLSLVLLAVLLGLGIWLVNKYRHH